jgi:hypothetical protein
VEDDGNSMEYMQGATKTTHWVWSDAQKTLTWTVEKGTYPGGPQDYVAVQAVLFAPGSKKSSDIVDIDASGSINF